MILNLFMKSINSSLLSKPTQKDLKYQKIADNKGVYYSL